MNPGVQRAVEAALGASVRRALPVAGGDINAVHRAELSDGRVVLVKANERAAPAMFPAEARGLEWLREARALRVPQVIRVSSGEPDEASFLVLEYLEPAPRGSDFEERLGRGLSALHRFGAPAFGLTSDNFIGRLPQENTGHRSWADFYRERRLLPQLRLADTLGHATRPMRKGFDRLFARLPELLGPEEAPSRLHGDLWAGNVHTDEHGEPCLIDPAAYGGHREVDLAMMRLFGGFGERCFSAYAEASPLAAGHGERVALYQLYPLMVHVNLFGGAYIGAALRVLAEVA
jgi:fructosamine-3-kinase